MNKIDRVLKNNYGSKKGFLKFWCYKALDKIGYFKSYHAGSLDYIPSRYVFVCAGNICRSPLAEAYATKLGHKAISFGLDTRGGDPADLRAIKFGESIGLDLGKHKTSRYQDYEPLIGDVIVAMEPRHISLYKRLNINVPIVLLGISSRENKVPYIHDPYNVEAEAFQKIERIVIEATKSFLTGSLRQPSSN